MEYATKDISTPQPARHKSGLSRMNENYIRYFNQMGINLEEIGHPLANFFQDLKAFNDPFTLLAFENLIMTIIVNLETLKRSNYNDFLHYQTHLQAQDISFWGIRYELQWYSILSKKLSTQSIQAFRRGQTEDEPDFIVDLKNGPIGVEITSLTYDETSTKHNAISKIKKAVSRKEGKPYADTNCCLIIDITNMIFYRKILSNFPTTISKLIDSLSSKFGAILLCQTIHLKDDDAYPRIVSQFYDWHNPLAPSAIREFVAESLAGPREDHPNKLIFPIG